jgi:hypothetical protein
MDPIETNESNLMLQISVDGQKGEVSAGRCTGADIKNAADVPRGYQLFRSRTDGDDTPVADNEWIVPVPGEKFFAVPPATGA